MATTTTTTTTRAEDEHQARFENAARRDAMVT